MGTPVRAQVAGKPKQLRAIDSRCDSPLCKSAGRILEAAHDSAGALLKAFDLARTQRGRSAGMSTDQEQDLLRAMLVMAAAGLDGMVKQLIRDALPSLLERDSKAQTSFEVFVERQFRPDIEGVAPPATPKYLARLLSRPEPHKVLIDDYIRKLTDGSLQSSQSLYLVVGALGLWPPEVDVDERALTPIFSVRNKIIHELDINLKATRRTRNVRGMDKMIEQTDRLLMVGEKILKGVNGKLGTPA
jgi:hypothetical protein